MRAEADGRDFLSRSPMNLYTLLRARLGVEARPADNVAAFVQIQDARVFGEERDGTGAFNTISNTKNLDVHQAFIKIEKFLFNELSVKVGRQELVYGNERLVGAVGWSNIGRSFDGGLIRWSNPSMTTDFFLMNTGETNIPPVAATPAAVKFNRDEGQLFSGIYYSRAITSNHQADVYLFHQLNRKRSVPNTDDLSRYTIGSYAKGTMSRFFYEAEVAYQTGKISVTDVGASMLTGSVGVSLSLSAITSVAVGADLLSGTATGSADSRTFDPPFATGHKFYGFMDYFIAIPSNTYNGGVRDLYLRCTAKPAESVLLNVWIHDFAFAETQFSRKNVGQEIDIIGAWRYAKNLTLEAGITAFIPGEVMQFLYGRDVATWMYVSAQLVF